MYKRGIRNESQILNARLGIYDGKKYTFTHRNPKTGALWCEDFKNGDDVPDGRWIDADKVSLL